MTNKLTIQGKSTDGKVVWNGASIFWMMDSQGMPLEVIVTLLRRRGEGFDVKGFIEVALQSKNFTPERIRSRLLNCYKGKDRQVVEDLIDEYLEREKEE